MFQRSLTVLVLGWVGAAAVSCASKSPPPASVASGEAEAPHGASDWQPESKGYPSAQEGHAGPAARPGYPAPAAQAPAPYKREKHSADEESSRAAADSAGAAAPAPWRRPGLATQWGETRESRITETRFDRAHPASPSAVAAIRYDDEDGVEALTGIGSRHAYAGVFPLRGGALTVSVADTDGDPLPGLSAGGTHFVVGDEGDRYNIVVNNHSPGRFEIVASVDGLDVIDGQDAEFSKRGYILSPWGSLTIEGFRSNYDTVQAFRFGEIQDSYAVARGRGADVGVIGVAVFEERGFVWPHFHPQPRQEPNPFPGRFAPPPGY